MKLNTQLLDQFKNTDSTLLAVTKYWNKEETLEIERQLDEQYQDILFGLGENRLESLEEKQLERETTHFIGELQTKKIKYIIDRCATIHSLDQIKHARKLNDICESKKTWIKVFIQINLDPQKEGGINGKDLGKFLEQIDELENIGVLGISGMGKIDCTREEKEAEFEYLIDLKNKHLQNAWISAGTSSDYEIAIEKGIDIIRIGQGLIK